MKKILILANDVTTILQFRCELISAFVEYGNDVIVSVPKSERIVEIEALGAQVVITDVARRGKNPLKDIRTYRQYKKLLKDIKPDVVLTFTIKPNVYGGMACGKMKIPYVANITGLGVVEKQGLLQKLMLFLYRKGLKKAQCVFFQNQANKDFFEKKKIVKGKTELLPGSGVNVDKFHYLDFPKGENINIVFVGRIMKEKGVFELAEAIRGIDRKGVKFTILGDAEQGAENPFMGMENVECVGYKKNVVDYLSQAHAIVLPSYHEGMANVLLEAASCGRAVLASRIPGCQEAFDESVTGFGFEKEDVTTLKEAINKFLNLTQEQKCEMGRLGREKMLSQFNRRIVINKYFEQVK